MHASIRRYQIAAESAVEFTRLVDEGFVPIIRQAPGFIAYYGVDEGNGTWASVSIFENQDGAEESNRQAADFVKQHLAQFIKEPPLITQGQLVIKARA